jgi:hypothetical protein
MTENSPYVYQKPFVAGPGSLPEGTLKEVGGRTYVVRKDGAWQRQDNHRQIKKEKTWRRKRRGAGI